MIEKFAVAMVLGLLAASPPSYAQGRLPTDQEIAQAKNRNTESLNRIPSDYRSQSYAGSLPQVEKMPTPNASPMDIDKLADQYKKLGQRQPAPGKRTNDLLVFVSFSIPKGSMERILDQAELSGATLMFRGLRGDSMAKMTEEIKQLIGNRKVGVVIHPPAFQQFTITKVPTVVLARAEAGNVLDNGCAQANTFVKVAGDVTIDYALEHIEKNNATWAPLAASYRRKLGGFYQ